jgi:hypothetical protein
MPMLTVRLTEDEYAVLKELGAGSSMAAVVKGWIAGDGSEEKPTEAPVVSRETVAHQACDRALADCERRLAAAKAMYTPMLDVLMSIYAKTARQQGPQFLLYSDLIDRVRAVVDEEAVF